jgi:hypothetical protein
MTNNEKPFWILYMATFPPRECGIATFTKDLTKAIDKKYSPKIKSKILAMNRSGISIYNYPKNVIFQIDDTNIQEYIDVAKEINKTDAIKLVSIQSIKQMQSNLLVFNTNLAFSGEKMGVT